MSPPHNNIQQPQSNSRNGDNLLITQPSSIPSSPLPSPSAQSSSSQFCLQSPSALTINQETATEDHPTSDPNWQANKPSVRERNAAMFNNELMADVTFLVGCDGEL
jgi:BTB/POZ domain-containing protein 3/6